jgi:cell shape-determining protein MreC
MEIFDFIGSMVGNDFEVFKGMLGHAAQSSLGEKLIVVSVVWFAMRNKVKDHFSAVNNSLAAINSTLSDIVKSVNDLKESLIEVERTHSERINKLSDRVKTLEDKNNNQKEQ